MERRLREVKLEKGVKCHSQRQGPALPAPMAALADEQLPKESPENDKVAVSEHPGVAPSQLHPLALRASEMSFGSSWTVHRRGPLDGPLVVVLGRSPLIMPLLAV